MQSAPRILYGSIKLSREGLSTCLCSFTPFEPPETPQIWTPRPPVSRKYSDNDDLLLRYFRRSYEH
jgi:hypothetical protein